MSTATLIITFGEGEGPLGSTEQTFHNKMVEPASAEDLPFAANALTAPIRHISAPYR